MLNTRYRWQLLDAGPLMLDGGSMFGVIPKVVWQRNVTPDDRNRITLRHNCLLLESDQPHPSLGRPTRTLIEAGTGDKLDDKMTAIFSLDRARTAESAVIAAGIDPAEIDAVIVTHLHFDHAGGLTRRCRDSETPDWTATNPGDASGDDPAVKLTFPNARVVVQQREWQDAIANDAVMTRTYYRDHLLPLELPMPDSSPRLNLVDSPQPYRLGKTPHRDDLPPTPLAERTTKALPSLLPGVRVFLTPGHTWGQQAIMFDDPDGNTVVFTPDVMPTAWHTGAAYSLAYDVEPYTSMLSRRWFLHEAAANNWLLVLDHDPNTPLVRATPDDKGWWQLDPA